MSKATTKKILNWQTKPRETELITKIAVYFVQMALDQGVEMRVADAHMDITAVHCNGCPLDLERMVVAIETGDTRDLGHDLAGIWNKWDRRNAEFKDFFWPRYAK